MEVACRVAGWWRGIKRWAAAAAAARCGTRDIAYLLLAPSTESLLRFLRVLPSCTAWNYSAYAYMIKTGVDDNISR